MKNKSKIIVIIAIIVILGIIIILQKNSFIKSKESYTSKEDIISLLDRGTKSSSKVNIFILSRETLDEEYKKIINEGKYKDLIGFVDLSKYKADEFEFVFLKETNDCILGYFMKNNDNINGITYIRIDKKDGRLKELDNNLFKVTIY